MSKKKQKNQAQASPNANTAVQQRATTSAPKESITRQSFFDTISTPMALGFLVAGFLCTVLYAYWDFFTFKSLIFYTDMASDSVTAYYPGIKMNDIMVQEYRNGLSGYPVFSLYKGMGVEYFPNLYFTLDQYFWAPIDALFNAGISAAKLDSIYSLSFKLAFDSFKMALIMFFYFKLTGARNFASVIGGLMFAFLGYYVLGASGWYGNAGIVFKFSLMLLAFELFLVKRVWYLIPVAVYATGFDPNMVFIYLFLALYLPVRFFSLYGFNGIIKKAFVLLGGSIAATAVGLFFRLPEMMFYIKMATNSPRMTMTKADALVNSEAVISKNGGFAEPLQYITAVMRTFSNDIMGISQNFKGWYNYLEAPAFYCGLLTLLMLPLAFKYFNKRERLVYGAFLLFWILIITFPALRHTFNLQTGDYYKRSISIFVPFTFMFLGIQAFSGYLNARKISPLLLFGSLFLWLILLFYPYKAARGLIDKDIRSTVAMYMVVYTILLYLLQYAKTRLLAQALILLLVVVELATFSHTTLLKRDVLSVADYEKREGFNDYTKEAVAYAQTKNNSFYRITKEFSSAKSMHGGLNDAQVFGYYGTKVYGSFNHTPYVNFLVAMGLADPKNEATTRWAVGVSGSPLLQGWASVKYLVTKDKADQYMRFGIYEPESKFNDITMLRNKFFIPFGFSYDKYITPQAFAQLSPLNRQLTILKAAVLDPESNDATTYLQQFNLADTTSNYTLEEFAAATAARAGSDTFAIDTFNHAYFKGKVNMSARKLMFFSIPYYEGWSAKIDGQPVKMQLTNVGFLGLTIPAGMHEVELSYFPTQVYMSYSTSAILQGVFFFGLLGFAAWDFWRKRGKTTTLVTETQ